MWPSCGLTVTETTALGAAYAAGLATGYWRDQQELSGHMRIDRVWTSSVTAQQRQISYHYWRKAVSRTLDWLE